MLTLREPIQLNSQREFLTASEDFGARIAGNYALLAAHFTPKDLLFLLTAPPELPEDLGGMTTIAVQNSAVDVRTVTMDVVNHVVNRILLEHSDHFTYQDQVYITSVLNKQRILEVLQTAVRVFQSRKRRIATSEFNDFMLPVIEQTPPPSTKGKYIRIKYAMQLPTPTPQFAFFVNLPQYIKEPYRRFLENKIREQWDFSGVPIQLYFRAK